MPKFFKQDLLSKDSPSEEPFLPNPLDTPELPEGDEPQKVENSTEGIYPEEVSEAGNVADHSVAPETTKDEGWLPPPPPPAPEVYHADSLEPSISEQQVESDPVDQNNEDTKGPEEEHDERPYPEHHQTRSREYEDSDELDPVKTLLTWDAASRPYRKKDRSFYTVSFVLIALISAIALLAGQIMLIGVLLAFLFLVYALNFVPPEDVEYKISTQGVTISDHFYHWQELDSFWFTEKEGSKLLHILTRLRFPGVLIIVLGEKEEGEVKRVVARYLPYHEIAPKSLMDKWAEGLQRHFPLENPHR
jgi:hypothetical protein